MLFFVMYFKKNFRPGVSNVVTIIYFKLPGKDHIKVTSEEIFQSLFHNGELCPVYVLYMSQLVLLIIQIHWII
jgi:hypothetical protein